MAPLAAFAAGAVVTAALADVRGRSAPETRTTELAATEVRPVQDAPRPLEMTPARAPTAPVIAAPTSPPPNTVAPAPTLPSANPLVDDAKQPDMRALADELQQLRDQVARLKQELGQARADSQTAVLLDVDRHVAGIGAQLAENQARHEEESDAAQSAAAQRHQAVQMLFAANGRLTAGDSDVLDSLDAASAALPYPAQTALRNARERIESKDLSAARYWIGVAILESGWSQLVQ
jgi:hypothetical protein